MSDSLVHFHDQLRAVWKARDKDSPFVRGLLRVDGNGSDNTITMTERWFALIAGTRVLLLCFTGRDELQWGAADGRFQSRHHARGRKDTKGILYNRSRHAAAGINC